MVTLFDLNPHGYPTTLEMDQNLTTLIDRINRMEEIYGSPFKVTSGLRSKEEQMRINPKAPRSKHLLGAAVDVLDYDQKLKTWLKNRMADIVKVGLYLEDFSVTPNWVHFQCLPPKSGRRIFMP